MIAGSSPFGESDDGGGWYPGQWGTQRAEANPPSVDHALAPFRGTPWLPLGDGLVVRAQGCATWESAAGKSKVPNRRSALGIQWGASRPGNQEAPQLQTRAG